MKINTLDQHHYQLPDLFHVQDGTNSSLIFSAITEIIQFFSYISLTSGSQKYNGSNLSSFLLEFSLMGVMTIRYASFFKVNKLQLYTDKCLLIKKKLFLNTFTSA